MTDLGYPTVDNFVYVPIPTDRNDAEYFLHTDPVFKGAIETHRQLEGESFEDLFARAPTCIRVPIDLIVGVNDA